MTVETNVENPIQTCSEFQDQLPELFESGGAFDDQTHLLTCENCAALVRDLRYIADQAKLLLPLHDPSPAVWEKISNKLADEKTS